MNKAKLYLQLIWLTFVGNLMKLKVRFQLRFLKHIPLSENVQSGLVISLTSYGHRVTNNSVCYTLHSLLTQHLRAEHIVLWLDEEEFNDHTLPPMLRRIASYGIEVRYCKNIRSFKKIIPSLQSYPNCDIITVDDDIYYSANLVSELVSEHNLHPKDVVALGVRMPALSQESGFLPYKQWTIHHHIAEDFTYPPLLPMPVGAYGILYPAHVFDKEAVNMDVAMQLCPQADDLWLYIMGLRGRVNKRIVRCSRVSYYQIDLLRQKFSRDRLYAKNVGEDMNDVQLKQLLTHYHINPVTLI